MKPNNLLEFAKGNRLTSLLALEAWKAQCGEHSFHSVKDWLVVNDAKEIGKDLQPGQLVLVSGVEATEITKFCIKTGWRLIGQENKTTCVDNNTCKQFLYIDTQGNFQWETLLQVLEEHSVSVQTTYWNHIYYHRVIETSELMALFRSLPKFLEEHSELSCIIVDSIDYPLQPYVPEQRENLLSLFLYELYHLAKNGSQLLVLMKQVELVSEYMPLLSIQFEKNDESY